MIKISNFFKDKKNYLNWESGMGERWGAGAQRNQWAQRNQRNQSSSRFLQLGPPPSASRSTRDEAKTGWNEETNDSSILLTGWEINSGLGNFSRSIRKHYPTFKGPLKNNLSYFTGFLDFDITALLNVLQFSKSILFLLFTNIITIK